MSRTTLSRTTICRTNLINHVRTLAASMPNMAKSGHPGAPMGCAPMAVALFSTIMRYDPRDATFAGRDRFVLSNGHSCALLYAALFLFTDHLTESDLKSFRQLGSKTPGHPEAHITAGVEVTTGPLGQGIAQAVGLALAQQKIGSEVGHLGKTFVIVGDGCLQEGISSEASSLAGHWGLGNLVVLWDDNRITIDGSTDLSFTEDVLGRYQSYGWQTMTVEDGDTDLDSIIERVERAVDETSKPTIIKVKTTIGFGSAMQGTAKVHGAPIGDSECERLRTLWGLPEGQFSLDDATTEYLKEIRAKKEQECDEYRAKDIFEKLNERINVRAKSFGTDDEILELVDSEDLRVADSTRNHSGKVLNNVHRNLGGLLVGGSADLTSSNMTALKGSKTIGKGNFNGSYIPFGVREHAMTAITAGMQAHGGFAAFCATFLAFVTYAYPSLRLCALSKFPIMFVASHDSIELGEDGPTHQPVEVLPLLRSTPNLYTMRPADGNETAGAYAFWLKNRESPTVGCFSRGKCLPLQASSAELTMHKGGYVVKSESNPNDAELIVLAGSGTEVQVCLEASDILGPNCRVVSMPCMDLFEEQSAEYCCQVLGKNRDRRFFVEASSGIGVDRYFNRMGSTFMTTFGESAPSATLMNHFGFTAQKIADRVRYAIQYTSERN